MRISFNASDRRVLATAILAIAPFFALAANQARYMPDGHGYAALTQDRSNDIGISDLRATIQGRLLRVQADLSNTSVSDRQVYYRFEWLDQQGIAVWDDEPWKPIIVYGLNKQTLSVSSPTFKATRFRLVVQSPN
ncbi:DUF1425 domain-containing protein [Propionivibrio sp.]|uniref:DUF1425 domain-containing protein n=1 Tax=Propionivibrio sp. TaxID=2212460 RepID=UPI0025F6E521|nr:DUF1425 domain-containing protein [Propionivibrio sp.]MBK7354740.1 DUF1425 domain-containing protein [Propionivibrio sp.]MBK8402111.1 DUF1425 domain-containing protein [Propionivibrio sp.]MBK8745797.1 DUF1425 domain-containing protein [Propionivibrio sp.]MBK8893398.1 DUF1425 domain-containing protein [Propionivibrio sp.]MBL0207543.1 DUF1425 domain-containing protein [Propionivibrio sp.]